MKVMKRRHEICEKHGIGYKVVEHPFDTREDVLVRMVTNQLARRNLTVAARVQLAERMHEAVERQAKDRMLAGKASDPVQNSAQGKSREQLAKIAETSRETYRKVQAVLEKAPEEIIERTLSGSLIMKG